MFDIELTDGLIFSQTAQLAFDRKAFLFKDRLPGILFVTCHVIIGMVTGNDHQGLQQDSFITACLHSGENIVQAGGGFYCTDIIIVITVCCQMILQILIDLVGIRAGTVAHEYDGCLSVIIFGCPLCNGLYHSFIVFLTGDQGDSDRQLIESVRVLGRLFHQIIIFMTIHHVGRLDDQLFYLIINCSLQGSFHVIDLYTIPLCHMLNNDVGSKGPADRVVRESVFQGLLNGADGHTAAVIIAGTETDDQQFFVSDFILVAGIVKAGVTGLVILFFFLFRRGCIAGRGSVTVLLGFCDSFVHGGIAGRGRVCGFRAAGLTARCRGGSGRSAACQKNGADGDCRKHPDHSVSHKKPLSCAAGTYAWRSLKGPHSKKSHYAR